MGRSEGEPEDTDRPLVEPRIGTVEFADSTSDELTRRVLPLPSPSQRRAKAIRERRTFDIERPKTPKQAAEAERRRRAQNKAPRHPAFLVVTKSATVAPLDNKRTDNQHTEDIGTENLRADEPSGSLQAEGLISVAPHAARCAVESDVEDSAVGESDVDDSAVESVSDDGVHVDVVSDGTSAWRSGHDSSDLARVERRRQQRRSARRGLLVSSVCAALAIAAWQGSAVRRRSELERTAKPTTTVRSASSETTAVPATTVAPRNVPANGVVDSISQTVVPTTTEAPTPVPVWTPGYGTIRPTLPPTTVNSTTTAR